MPLNSIVDLYLSVRGFIVEHIEYPVALVFGFAGREAGVGAHLGHVELIGKFVDGFIGVFFVIVSVILTHITKRCLVNYHKGRRARNIEKLKDEEDHE